VRRMPACGAALPFLAFLDLGWGPWWAWVAGVLVAIVVLVAVYPYFFVIRLPLWILSHVFYRFYVRGMENVPKTGPVLMVCNHVSHIDALLVLITLKRKVRFVIWAPFTRVPVMGRVLKLANVIPIDSAVGPRALVQSLRAASEALAKGEAICIFAEGGITRTGFLLPFHRGFEQIVKRCPAPIVPVCLDNLWGSVFSYQGGKFFWKWPQRLPYPVFIGFGKPMPADSGAVAVRTAIQLLSAESSIARADIRRPVHRQFVRMAARHPLKSCLVDPTNQQKPVLRYFEVLVGAKILAARLRPILRDARMVGLWLPPTAGAAVANIAISFLGKVSVNLNYTSAPDVVQAAIKQCNITHVLTARAFLHKVNLEPGPSVELVYIEEFRKQLGQWEKLQGAISALLLPGWLQEHACGLTTHGVNDLATVIFSSGSTGEPKGVMLSHGNLAANLESMIQAINLRPRDRLLGVLPFFHSFGYTVTLWGPLQSGASGCFHVDPRQAKEIGEICKKYACTIFLTTATFLRFCLRRCESDDFLSLRLLICGAEKLPSSLAQEFHERFRIQPMEGYGCTELSPAVSANVPDWQDQGVKQVGNRPGTIGQPLPGIAAKIVNPDSLEELAPGKEGLLLVYGANVMQGYLGRPELTSTVIRDGWYITGDIARYDEDGFLTITDRLSRFSKIGGEMVPHQKIEDLIHQIMGTSERHVAITAVPDESKGERLIVLHLPWGNVDAKQIWQQLNGSGLPNLWIPRERDFYEIPEMPVLGTGKVDLKRVKETALSMVKS
jgi:acyl-[acyl-carrier-protein]-phospholipid O-acyltransferase / long-chain-fatty-acid--[acyl-carrier-protein] ligase